LAFWIFGFPTARVFELCLEKACNSPVKKAAVYEENLEVPETAPRVEDEAPIQKEPLDVNSISNYF